MGVKVKYTTKDDGFPSMKKQLETLNGSGVEVGVLRGSHAWLASIHEYGCDIKVTKKMRAWFLYNHGINLKTTTIHIPERSFLRSGYDKHRDKVMEKAKLLLGQVAAGKMTASGCYTAVGLELSSKIKEYATELNSPPNSGFTTGQKGSSNPLVDTGDMIGGITWRKSK